MYSHSNSRSRATTKAPLLAVVGTEGNSGNSGPYPDYRDLKSRQKVAPSLLIVRLSPSAPVSLLLCFATHRYQASTVRSFT